jgi:hypothetical protein
MPDYNIIAASGMMAVSHSILLCRQQRIEEESLIKGLATHSRCTARLSQKPCYFTPRCLTDELLAQEFMTEKKCYTKFDHTTFDL